jgi:AraC-like DNA-binding protein
MPIDRLCCSPQAKSKARAALTPPDHDAPSGHCFLLAEGAVLLCNDFRVQPRHQMAGSLTLALDRPFRMRVPQSDWREVFAVAASSSSAVEIDAGPHAVIHLQMDPESDAYAQLHDELWRECKVVVLEAARVALLQSHVSCARTKPAPGQALWQAVLSCFEECAVRPPLDARVAVVRAALKQAQEPGLRISDLARHVRLSERRLSQLFHGQVGLAPCRYRVWRRLRTAVGLLANRSSITDAAHAAGFADAAHFSRVFREAYGIAPARILRSPVMDVQIVPA